MHVSQAGKPTRVRVPSTLSSVDLPTPFLPTMHTRTQAHNTEQCSERLWAAVLLGLAELQLPLPDASSVHSPPNQPVAHAGHQGQDGILQQHPVGDREVDLLQLERLARVF